MYALNTYLIILPGYVGPRGVGQWREGRGRAANTHRRGREVR